MPTTSFGTEVLVCPNKTDTEDENNNAVINPVFIL
jgi:hypothetical protein